MKPQTNWRQLITLIPVFGILSFIILYIIAALYYPGGSQANKLSVGFSWADNYWCNLLNEKAINGENNMARPIAITAALILSVSLSVFWFSFPVYIPFKKTGRLIIQVSGILSMTLLIFLFTSLHDVIINVAGAFGLVAMTGVFIGLYRIKANALLVFGFFNVLLIGLNNYIYHGSGSFIYLPVIQKLSFLSFLFWISMISIALLKRQKEN
ncbi:MAG: hypothetical protein ABJA78_15660 [Ferruginibacter sp.]